MNSFEPKNLSERFGKALHNFYTERRKYKYWKKLW